MNITENPNFHEGNKPSFIIKPEDGKFRITSPRVELGNNNEPLNFTVTVRKLLTSIEYGEILQGVIIDNKSPKLQRMRLEATDLRKLPERERIDPLVRLVRENVQYPYSQAVNELGKSDPKKAEWIDRYTGLKSSPANKISLSDIIEAGYGVCRHISTITLSLAKDAGLAGSHLEHQGSKDYEQGKLINVLREDNGKPLFRTLEVNERFNRGHTWIELLMSDGEWIPVDPTTQLTGLTEAGRETYKKANYRGFLEPSIIDEGLPRGVCGIVKPSLHFAPGDKTASGIFTIKRKKDLSPYQGALNFILSSNKPYTGTNIDIISVKHRRKTSG